MSSNDGGPYIIRESGAADADDAEAWVAPEPAEAVIVEEILAATPLDRGEVEPLSDHVDIAALDALLSGDEGSVSFLVADHEVTVTHDGTVTVATA